MLIILKKQFFWCLCIVIIIIITYANLKMAVTWCRHERNFQLKYISLKVTLSVLKKNGKFLTMHSIPID